MLRRACLCLAVAALAFLPLGCEREAHRLQQDTERSVEAPGPEYQRLKADLRDWVAKAPQERRELALDAENFLEWRRREWWQLQSELAWHLAYDLAQTEKLLIDAGRFYGYEVAHLPKAKRDWLRFFEQADPEWRALVQDCMVFIERSNWEKMELRRDLREFYAAHRAEAAHFAMDVDGFLEWREREWNRLVRDAKSSLAQVGPEIDAFQRDVEMFRARAAVEQRRLRADLRAFWSEESQQPPKLLDDVTRWTKFRDREWEPLKRDVRDFAARANWESDRLHEDIDRLTWMERQRIPRLMTEVDEFLDVYHRETHPLSLEAKRFWRYEVAMGHVLPGEVRRFYQDASEESALLALDVDHSLRYASKEWDDLRRGLRRFVTGEGSAFDLGDPLAPHRDGPLINTHLPVPRAYEPE